MNAEDPRTICPECGRVVRRDEVAWVDVLKQRHHDPCPVPVFSEAQARSLEGSVPPVAKPPMEVNISFRVSRALRDAAAEKAQERQENVSDVLREALERYVRSK